MDETVIQQSGWVSLPAYVFSGNLNRIGTVYLTFTT